MLGSGAGASHTSQAAGSNLRPQQHTCRASRGYKVDEVLQDADDFRVTSRVVRRVHTTKAARDGAFAFPDQPTAIATTHDDACLCAGDQHPAIATRNDTSLCASDHAGSTHSETDDDDDDDDDDGGASDTESVGGQGLYPPSALFMRQCLPESAWSPDDSTDACRQCARRFTLFVRRHHCRRCGLVFCDSCSAQRALLASPTSPAQGGYYARNSGDDTTPLARLVGVRSTYWRFREHRACDPCARAVAALPAAFADSVALVVAELGSSDAAENAYNIFGVSTSDARDAVPAVRRQSSASIRICPVCDRDWATVWAGMRRVPGEGWQEAQERHIRECIEDTSAEMQGACSEPARRSRSIQTRPQQQASLDTVMSASQPRHNNNNNNNTGFLGFFDRPS
ncbi:hypothetical protein IWW50_006694, partial [Coemansia erecta]